MFVETGSKKNRGLSYPSLFSNGWFIEWDDPRQVWVTEESIVSGTSRFLRIILQVRLIDLDLIKERSKSSLG